MKNYFFVTCLCLAQGALASPNVLRSFDCRARTTPDGQSGAVTEFAVTMTDTSFDNTDFPGNKSYSSVLEFQAPFMPAMYQGQMPYHENVSEDVQAERDDDPEGRSGWGGTGIYGLVFGAEKNSGLFFFTKAKRSQENEKQRSYQIAIASLKTGADGNEEQQEILAAGDMDCSQK